MLWIGLAQAQPHLHSTGLRTELIADATSPTIDIAMAVAVGEVDDPVGGEGTAHGVEHLWFQTEFEGATVTSRLAELACAQNAFTGGEWMVFVESCPAAALDAVLELEAARFRPWTIPASGEREWRVVAQEELGRAEMGSVIEGDLVIRQLLPASHPVRLRATRPHHATYPGAAALQAFVAERIRPDRAALVITGPIDAAAIQSKLDQRFGASEAAATLAPLRTPQAARTVLRMAPRTVPAVALTPAVHIGWAQPEPTGMGGAVLDLYIERLLQEALAWDPRTASVNCAHEDVLFTRTFDCVLRTVDDAAATSLAADLPGVLKLLTPERTAKWFLELTAAQGTLWSAFVSERHVAEIGSMAAWRARGLIEGVAAPGPAVDLRKWTETALLADTALVLALPGGGAARPDFTRPGPTADVAPTDAPLPPLPAPVPPLEATVRTLENGLEVIAARRPDAILTHAELVAGVAADPVASAAAYGLLDRSRIFGEVIDVDADSGVWAIHHVATFPSLAGSAAQRLSARLGGLVWDPKIETRTRAASRTERLARGGAAWAALLPSLRLHDQEATRDPGTLSPQAGQKVLSRLFAPARARLVVVGPEPVDQALAPFVAAWSGWRGTSTGEPETVPLEVPVHARMEVPGVQAHIGLRCELPAGGAAGALAAAVVQDVLVREIREARGRGYHLSASAARTSLSVHVATDPDWAGDALRILLASLTTPGAGTLRNAQISVLGADHPARWAPDTLTSALALGTLDPGDLKDWDTTARGRTAAEVGADLSACAKSAAWAMVGPTGTAFPADAKPFDPAALDGVILR